MPILNSFLMQEFIADSTSGVRFIPRKSSNFRTSPIGSETNNEDHIKISTKFSWNRKHFLHMKLFYTFGSRLRLTVVTLNFTAQAVFCTTSSPSTLISTIYPLYEPDLHTLEIPNSGFSKIQNQCYLNLLNWLN